MHLPAGRPGRDDEAPLTEGRYLMDEDNDRHGYVQPSLAAYEELQARLRTEVEASGKLMGQCAYWRGKCEEILDAQDQARDAMQALRILSEAASPGPWEFDPGFHGDPLIAQVDRGAFGAIATAYPDSEQLRLGKVAMASTSPGDYGRANAQFIAAACNYVRELLAATSCPRCQQYLLIVGHQVCPRCEAADDEPFS